MNDAIERVSASCPKSQFKDDRHEWMLLSYDHYSLSLPVASYEVRRCYRCGLVILVYTTDGRNLSDSAPRRNDKIIHAFYENQ